MLVKQQLSARVSDFMRGVVAQPFLVFVVKHARGQDEDKSDGADHRTSYDTCKIVCKRTKMFEGIRLKKTSPRVWSNVHFARLMI